MISYRHNYMFVLDENIDAGFAGADENRFRYGIDQKSFLMLFWVPVIVSSCGELFNICKEYGAVCEGYTGEEKDSGTSVRETMYIHQCGGTNRKGCSVPLNVQTEPEGAAIPGLVFEYQVPDIVECTYQRVLAHNPGKQGFLYMKRYS